MTTNATETNTISIGGNHYRVLGSVTQWLANVRAPKITTGDYSDQSNPMASEFSLGDWRDGIGANRGDVREHLRRTWWSTGQTRYRDAFVLPRLAVQTAAGPAFEVHTLSLYKGGLYATYGTDVRLYNNSTNSWGSSLRTLASTATDTATGILYPSGTPTETLVVANGTDVDYLVTSTWAENTGQAIERVIFWGDLLWGITAAGRLYYTDDLSAAWTADAFLPLPSGSVTGLVAARGPDRENHIYAVTNQGLWVHDRGNGRFLPTDMELPVHPDGGKGFQVWRGKLYTSAGNAIYAFQAGADQTVVGVVGPDLDDGLPDGKRGTINHLLGSHNELMAFTNADGATGVSLVATRATRGFGNHHGVTISTRTGFSSILGWNERGWEVKWLSSASARAITAGVIGNESTASSTYRMWWASNQRVYYMDLPVDVVNPVQVEAQEYGDGATLETPWFDMGVRNQQKLALSVIVESIHPSTTETVEIEYATNFVETYTSIATKDTTGEAEYRLPGNISRQGVLFRAWKFRITLARGSTSTSTPQLVRITLVWRPHIKTLFGVNATLDITRDVNGVPPVQQFKNLRDSLRSGVLEKVSWRDDKTGDQEYLMDWLNYQPNEEAGQTSYGTVQVSLAEPLSTDGAN